MLSGMAKSPENRCPRAAGLGSRPFERACSKATLKSSSLISSSVYRTGPDRRVGGGQIDHGEPDGHGLVVVFPAVVVDAKISEVGFPESHRPELGEQILVSRDVHPVLSKGQVQAGPEDARRWARRV